MNPEIDRINEQIAKLYGNHPELDLPRFRVVWSDTQIEPRRNTEIWYGSIYMGNEFGIKNVPKYLYIRQRWILEKVFPNNPEGDLVANHTYEPIFTFQDKDDNPLMPNFKVVNFICWHNMYGERRQKTAAEFNEEERKQYESDVNFFNEYLKNNQSEYGLRTGEAVVVP